MTASITGWLSMAAAGEYAAGFSEATIVRATKATDPVQHLEYRQVKGKRVTRPGWVDEWIERQHNAA